jgi:hypothetical protein
VEFVDDIFTREFALIHPCDIPINLQKEELDGTRAGQSN